MRILFLANRVPYPPYRGDKLKIFHLARQLSRDHELHLLCFSQSAEELHYRGELLKYFKTVHFMPLPKWTSILQTGIHAFSSIPFQVAYFKSRAMRKAIQAFLRNTAVDMIHVQHLRMASYALPLGNQPAILDMPDAFSLYWKRRMDREKSWWARKFAGIEYRRLMAYEARMLKAFPRVLVCSSEDQDYLAACHPDARIDLLPNGVDLQTFKPGDHDYEATLPLLFTGNMDYAPNVDAVVHFVHEILPRIHAQIPDVEFVIAGQRPVKSVLDLASDKVKVTGFVEDLAAVYHSSSILVSPLRFGAGTQNKVLEAMAMGIPVVCSSIGFKGLGISSGEGAFCEEGDEAFANRVVSLLGSSQLRQETGAQGMAVARSKFGWEAIAGRLHELICDTRRLNLS